MYSTRLVFLIVFFFCSVHTYRSENERSAPVYEAADEVQDVKEEFGHREERTAAAVEDEAEAYADEEAYEPKPNKKSRKYKVDESPEEVVTENRDSHRGKKARKGEESVADTNGETGEENVYNKEMKNVSNKKGKKYNKKYESAKQRDIGNKGQATYEELSPVNYDEPRNEKPAQKTKGKRVRRSENKREAADQLPEGRSQEKDKSAKRSEADPSAEVSQESKPVKQNQKSENNRKSKSGKSAKQSKKKSGSQKKDKRSASYFGLWA